MLPSQYTIQTAASRSRRSNSSSTTNSILPHQQHPPALGITGVICTSRMIDLPNNDHRRRGSGGAQQLHCTIYRPRMMIQVEQPPPHPKPILSTSSTPGSTTTCHQKTRLPSTTNGTAVVKKAVVVPQLPKPKPPLICVAGGPNMSCQYLTGLVHLIPDRAIIIYDHCNCGQSTPTTPTMFGTIISSDGSGSSATDVSKNDVDKNSCQSDDGATTTSVCSYMHDTVNDLETLIEAIIPINTSYHLFGHSMGGIVVYEFLKRQRQLRIGEGGEGGGGGGYDKHGGRICISCIFASTPTNIAESFQYKEELIQSIVEELKETGYQRMSKKHTSLNDNNNNSKSDETETDVFDDDDTNDDVDEEQQLRQAAHIEFQQRHECRSVPLPMSLEQSLTGLNNSNKSYYNDTVRGHNISSSSRRRPHASTGSGIHPSSFNNYVATPLLLMNSDDQTQTAPTIKFPVFPPTLILRGQYDFVSEQNCRRWEDILMMDNNNNNNNYGRDRCQYITISNCSHYGFLEEENLYGTVVLSFLNDHDNHTVAETEQSETKSVGDNPSL